MRKKKITEEEFEKQLAEVEFTTESETREKEIVDLLKQLVNRNKKIISLLTKLKDIIWTLR